MVVQAKHRPCSNKRFPKAKKATAVWKSSKPDADNLAKIVADALNGIAWGDDAQIADLLRQLRLDLP